jgi:hypothetical protein
MEAGMYKATLTGTIAILAAVLLSSGRAEAGASASAASKYANTNQIASMYLVSGNRQARRADYGITEFSSSSARTHASKYR